MAWNLDGLLSVVRDPSWGAIGVVAAFVVPLVIWYWQRHKKRLTYRTVSKTALLTRREEIGGKIEVLYDGTPVKDIAIYVIEIANDGNVPIRSADFESDLLIGFDPRANILSCAVIDQFPEALAVDHMVEDHRIYIQPLLLNSKDKFTVKAIVSESGGEYLVSARIAGISEARDAGEFSWPTVILVAFFVLAALFGFWLTESSRAPRPELPLEGKIGSAIFLLSYVALTFLVLRGRFRRLGKVAVAYVKRIRRKA